MRISSGIFIDINHCQEQWRNAAVYFVSTGCSLSQTDREIMENLLKLVSQTVSLGCEALQSDNQSLLG